MFFGPLQSAEHEFGWGIGVQARSELSFALPDGVKSLRGSAGIDRSSGTGGCVKCRIFANDVSSPPLWESPILVGSATVADFGTQPLGGPAAGQKQVVMQVDPAHDGRPAGADPLDIRDAASIEAMETIVLPDVPEIIAPIIYALPVQMLAYFTAVFMGTDVDQPRNLAKSVTVE